MRASIASSFIGSLLLFACSGGNAGETSATTSGALDEGSFLDALAHAQCDDLGPCCAKASYGHDADKCRDAVKAGYGPLLDQMAGESFDGAKAHAFVELVRTATASCGEPEATSFGDFFRIWTPSGSGKPGDACERQNDCAAVAGGVSVCSWSAYAATSADAPVVDKKCVVYRPARVGMPCDEEKSSDVGNCGYDDFTGTGKDFYCANTGEGDGLCHARRTEGASCNGGDCARGLRCLDGVCAPRGTAGARCSSFDDCASGHFCDGDACQPFHAVGASCTRPDECAAARCSQGRCPATSVATAEGCGGTGGS